MNKFPSQGMHSYLSQQFSQMSGRQITRLSLHIKIILKCNHCLKVVAPNSIFIEPMIPEARSIRLEMKDVSESYSSRALWQRMCTGWYKTKISNGLFPWCFAQWIQWATDQRHSWLGTGLDCSLEGQAGLDNTTRRLGRWWRGRWSTGGGTWVVSNPPQVTDETLASIFGPPWIHGHPNG